jgi:hypothetical protein
MYELNFYIEDYQERIKNEQEERLMLTYLNAAWVRCKRMPSLNKLLGKTEPAKKKMTDEEMFKKVKMLHKALGGN